METGDRYVKEGSFKVLLRGSVDIKMDNCYGFPFYDGYKVRLVCYKDMSDVTFYEIQRDVSAYIEKPVNSLWQWLKIRLLKKPWPGKSEGHWLTVKRIKDTSDIKKRSAEVLFGKIVDQID